MQTTLMNQGPLSFAVVCAISSFRYHLSSQPYQRHCAISAVLRARNPSANREKSSWADIKCVAFSFCDKFHTKKVCAAELLLSMAVGTFQLPAGP